MWCERRVSSVRCLTVEIAEAWIYEWSPRSQHWDLFRYTGIALLCLCCCVTTTPNNESLGSQVDEERSKLREIRRIAGLQKPKLVERILRFQHFLLEARLSEGLLVVVTIVSWRHENWGSPWCSLELVKNRHCLAEARSDRESLRGLVIYRLEGGVVSILFWTSDQARLPAKLKHII